MAMSSPGACPVILSIVYPQGRPVKALRVARRAAAAVASSRRFVVPLVSARLRAVGCSAKLVLAAEFRVALASWIEFAHSTTHRGKVGPSTRILRNTRAS